MKLTIVVPAFNAEKTILNAIKSYKKIEKNNEIETKLIIVDDCSSDKTIKIIKKLNLKKIQVIKNTKNIGPGKSRNKALRYIKDGYVGFLDADDQIIAENYVESLKEGIKTNSDLITFNAYINNNDSISERYDYKRLSNDRKYLKTMCLRGEIDGSVIFSIYSLSLIKKNKLKFANDYYEDIIFSYKALMLSKKIYISKQFSYIKNVTKGSILNTISKTHINGMLNACIKFKKFIIDQKKFNKKINEYDYLFGFNGYVYHLIRCICQSEKEILEQLEMLKFLHKKSIRAINLKNYYSMMLKTQKDKVVSEFIKLNCEQSELMKFLQYFNRG